ncbi:MAG: hypothetical protein QOC80_1227 [Frankiaceae bacterium]|nr:hypothetical protein [Frankiaceae bacterium]
MPEPAVGLPVLGLSLHDDGDELLPLLGALRSWCRPTTLRGTSGLQPAAVLTDRVPSSPIEAPFDVPWSVVSRDPSVLEQAGARGRLLPDGVVPAGVAYVPPFVRERLRRARGLPEHAVLTADRRWTAGPEVDRPVPGDLLDTALACASLVVADDLPTAERALAWGAPTLCSPTVAEALGLVGTPEAVVATNEDPAVLVGDVRRLARLSWRGRRWWEARHDATLVAAQLALEMLPSTPGAARLRLAELGTPTDAEVRSRLSAALG